MYSGEFAYYAPTSLNEALTLLQHNKQFEPVQGVSSLFADQHSLDEVARLASAWFERWLLPMA